MKCLRLLIVLVLLMQSLFSQADPIENPLSCSLPAPAWINATEITSSSIKVEWADVNGSYGYRVSRFDVTHGVQLPDVDVAEAKYTSQPHDPGTTISFEVWPKCENGELGSSIGGEYTTNYIVVDDIVNFTAPNSPIGNTDIPPNQNQSFGFTNAAVYQPTVDVLRLKVTFTDPHNNLHFAEVLMWSQCADQGYPAPRLKYWNKNLWQQDVSYTENHLNENPASPIVSITFRFENSSEPFFTICCPTMTYPINNAPIQGGLTIHNDRSPSMWYNNTIHVARIYNNEHNDPCYVSHLQGSGDGPIDQITFSNQDVQGDGESSIIKIAPAELAIIPNPFSDGFNAVYTLETESPVTFCLFDHTGRKIKTMNLPDLPTGHYSTGISTNDLPAGIYMLSFQTNQGRTVTTVVKH